MDQGLAQEALDILNAALEEKADNSRLRAAILELRGTLYYQFDHMDYALQDFEHALAALGEAGMDHELAGSIHASMGAAYHALEKTQDTVEHWQKAIEHYQQNDPPLHIDTATLSNNLGFLYKQANDMDSAENSFLRALQILHGELGKYDAFTATVFCNLGCLYQQAGFLDQAREMHDTSLTIRSKMLGKAHPDTAQSHNNMALTMMENGEYDDARTHFEAALKSFGALGPGYDEDFQAVRANYIDLLHEIGEYELADELEAKYA
jgi:tetratricopeptide (TPR) repeat protein